MRMEDERIPKKTLNGKFHYASPVGRARTKWKEVVLKETLQILGIRRWRRGAEDEKKRGIFYGGQGPEGAVAPSMERNIILSNKYNLVALGQILIYSLYC